MQINAILHDPVACRGGPRHRRRCSCAGRLGGQHFRRRRDLPVSGLRQMGGRL